MNKQTMMVLVGVVLASAAGAGAVWSGADAQATSPDPATLAVAAEAPVVTLYKNPSCACCAEWGEHLEENGFEVKVEEAGWDLMQLKTEHGVSPDLASCHTALVGDYVLEGHVPADLVAKLLEEQPDSRGLAVPGMPAGVPGMPEAGPNRAPFEILAVQPDGTTDVYATR